jgi:hypothetical protein
MRLMTDTARGRGRLPCLVDVPRGGPAEFLEPAPVART